MRLILGTPPGPVSGREEAVKEIGVLQAPVCLWVLLEPREYVPFAPHTSPTASSLLLSRRTGNIGLSHFYKRAQCYKVETKVYFTFLSFRKVKYNLDKEE